MIRPSCVEDAPSETSYLIAPGTDSRDYFFNFCLAAGILNAVPHVVSNFSQLIARSPLELLRLLEHWVFHIVFYVPSIMNNSVAFVG